MERCRVIQDLLDLYRDPSYLEIGVNQGHTFLPLSARVKVGVDPQFAFDIDRASRSDPTSTFYSETSDSFFLRSFLSETKFDVIFIDGLHTYDQTLRDLMNSLQCLNDGGVIIVDDVMPSDYAASVEDISTMLLLRRQNGDSRLDWMGDVFKLVFFVQSFLPMFSYATIAENHGQTVLWRDAKARESQFTTRDIDALAFKDCYLHRDVFNLMPFDMIRERIRNVRDARCVS